MKAHIETRALFEMMTPQITSPEHSQGLVCLSPANVKRWACPHLLGVGRTIYRGKVTVLCPHTWRRQCLINVTAEVKSM